MNETCSCKVLAVLAHPDDAEIWCGGTLAIHARLGEVVVMTSSSDPVRRREAETSAQILGARPYVLEHLSIEIVLEVIKELRPTILITHRLDDTHPDHRAVAGIVLTSVHETLIEVSSPKRLYSCDTYESVSLNGPIQPSHIVDVTETFEIKMSALRAHKSQPLDHFAGMARRIGSLWGARVGTTWAEAFSAIPILGRLPSTTHL